MSVTQKQFILLSFFLAIFSFLKAQDVFHRTYASGEFYVVNDVVVSGNGDFVTAGSWTPSSSVVPMQPHLARMNAQGDVLWAYEYAGPGVGTGNAVCKTRDGGFIMVGKTDTILGTGGSFDGFLTKVDSLGNKVWMKVVGSNNEEELNRVYEAPNGEIIAVGAVEVPLTSDEYFWFLRLDTNGTVLHSFLYFPTLNSEAHALAFHPDGGYVIGGTGRVNFIDEAYLFKISNMGVLEWYKSYGAFSTTEVIHDILIREDKSIVFTGSRISANRGIFVGKTDSLGNKEWFLDYGKGDHEEAHRILEDPAGGYMVAGWTEDLNGVAGPFLMKIDSLGFQDWAATYGSGVPAGTVGLDQCPDGYWALAGTTLPNQGSAIGHLFKIKPDGEGCDYQLAAFDPLMEISSLDTPVVYATTGSGGNVSFLPTINSLSVQDSVWCLEVGLEEAVAQGIVLFPNPTSGPFRVVGPEAIVRIELFDLQGKIQFEVQGTALNEIQPEGLENGLYYLRAFGRSGNSWVKRLVIRP